MPRAQTKVVETPTDSTTPAPDERWTVVQVAAFLSLPYQRARNNMLAGDYGITEYDAKSRKLTVSADRVRASKKRGRPKKTTRKRSSSR